MDRKITKQDDKPFTTNDARAAMLDAIRKAEGGGIGGDTLDRMRLACEFFTNPEFRAAVAGISREVNRHGS